MKKLLNQNKIKIIIQIKNMRKDFKENILDIKIKNNWRSENILLVELLKINPILNDIFNLLMISKKIN